MITRFLRFIARHVGPGLRAKVLVSFVTEHAHVSPGEAFTIGGAILPDGSVRIES